GELRADDPACDHAHRRRGLWRPDLRRDRSDYRPRCRARQRLRSARPARRAGTGHVPPRRAEGRARWTGAPAFPEHRRRNSRSTRHAAGVDDAMAWTTAIERRARVTGRSSGRLWCWLIERLVSTPHRDAMIGDLIEQSRRSRSETWWARQACAIILG